MKLKALINSIDFIITSTQQNFMFVSKLLIVLWGIHLINRLIGYRLNILGIIPRSFVGLRGIFFSTFLHGDFNHLFFNSVPLFVLTNLVLLNGRNAFYAVSLFIIITSGFAIWLFGKRGIHVGASALIMGYFGYLLAGAYFKFDAMAIIMACLCVYYFGGLALELIPSGDKGISWEGHVLGFLSGVAASYLSPIITQLIPIIYFIFTTAKPLNTLIASYN